MIFYTKLKEGKHNRHEEKSVRSHSSSVLHLYILKIFIPLQFLSAIFDVSNIWCTIFDVQYSCGQYLKHLRFALFCRQYLKHLRFALFWVLQICHQFCFWYPTFFPIFIWNFLNFFGTPRFFFINLEFSQKFFSNFFLVPPDFFS